MQFSGVPMIQHIAAQLRTQFASVVVGANDAEKYRFLDLPVIADEEIGKGPLMGILSCVARSPHEWVFVTGCDIPHIQQEFVEQMIRVAGNHDIVMPTQTDGRQEPLFALYRKSVVEPARAIVKAGGRRIVELFDHVDAHFVEMPAAGWYYNVNERSDFEQASRALAPDGNS